jgi:hypothetical protein
MTRNRHLARLLVRLAIPVAAVLAVTATTGTAEAFRPQLGCTYGWYYEYYDEFGNICATSETCNNTGWGDCDDDETYSSYEQYHHLCYCDP